MKKAKTQLKITQVRSTIGRDRRQRVIIRGLGLGKLNRSVVRENTPSIRGMVKKVIHLLKVEEVNG
ncbi:MAG: 50S ribosomal protein L30 [Pseudomonadota bacterium]